MFAHQSNHRLFSALTRRAVLSVALFATLATVANAAEPEGTKLLSAQFAPRPVTKVDSGDFHFLPGQPAPLHTHAAPAIGYVSKGAIFYQVRGQKPQLLKAGDAFYEPTGVDILHFDNASKTEEAVFMDFNLERTGEPFIVFPKPPTAKIDRRTLTTSLLDNETVSQVDVYAQMLVPGATVAAKSDAQTVLYYVAEGSISVRIGGETNVYSAGQNFYAPKGGAVAELRNASEKTATKLIGFYFGTAK